MKRVLCAWLPDWPLQRLYAARPELSNRGIVLYEPQPRGILEVVLCSPRAAERHVSIGMTLAEATALGQEPVSSPRPLRSPPPVHNPKRERATHSTSTRTLSKTTAFPPVRVALHFEQHDPAADRQALEQWAGWCEQFSPIVGWEEGANPETLVMDATGIGPLFGGEAALVEHVVRAFGRAGWVARAALADTLGAAWAMAHFAPADAAARGDSTKSPSKKSNTTFHEPGAWVIAPGATAAALAELPVESLRLSPLCLKLLGELGLRSVGQLLPLERSALATRLGEELLLRLDQAMGQAREVVSSLSTTTHEVSEQAFEVPLENAEVVEQALLTLLENVTAPLNRRCEGVQHLQCIMQCVGAPPLSIPLGVLRPTARARHLWELLKLRLERTRLPGPVTSLRIEVNDVGRLECWQPGLFRQDSGEISRDDPRALAELLERLSSRLGGERVVRARPVADAQPEYAWRYEPLVARRTRARPRVAAKKPSRKKPEPFHRLLPESRALDRPLHLAQPERLDVTSVVPDGPPVSFRFHEREHRIVRFWGPERIETGWWRGRGARRDYYRVETAEAGWFWLFRRLIDGQWFYQGTFE